MKRKQDFVALDELSHLLNCLGWAETVIVLYEFDFSAVDAARIIYHFEVCRLGFGDARYSRCGPTERHGLSNFDLSVGGADVILLLSNCGGHEHGGPKHGGCSYFDDDRLVHGLPPRNRPVHKRRCSVGSFFETRYAVTRMQPGNIQELDLSRSPCERIQRVVF